MANRHAMPGTRPFELAGDTAILPAYLMVSIGPYRANPALRTKPEAGNLPQESKLCMRFSPVHHHRRSAGVGRTAEHSTVRPKRPCRPGRAESTTSGMVPAFLIPSPF